MESLLRDSRHNVRMLAKAPGFAVVALLTLTLGIGANAAIFQLLDAVRLRTLPVNDPHTLATVAIRQRQACSGTLDFPVFRGKNKRPEFRSRTIKFECHSIGTVARPLRANNSTGLLHT